MVSRCYSVTGTSSPLSSTWPSISRIGRLMGSTITSVFDAIQPAHHRLDPVEPSACRRRSSLRRPAGASWRKFASTSSFDWPCPARTEVQAASISRAGQSRCGLDRCHCSLEVRVTSRISGDATRSRSRRAGGGAQKPVAFAGLTEAAPGGARELISGYEQQRSRNRSCAKYRSNPPPMTVGKFSLLATRQRHGSLEDFLFSLRFGDQSRGCIALPMRCCASAISKKRSGIRGIGTSSAQQSRANHRGLTTVGSACSRPQRQTSTLRDWPAFWWPAVTKTVGTPAAYPC